MNEKFDMDNICKIGVITTALSLLPCSATTGFDSLILEYFIRFAVHQVR